MDFIVWNTLGKSTASLIASSLEWAYVFPAVALPIMVIQAPKVIDHPGLGQKRVCLSGVQPVFAFGSRFLPRGQVWASAATGTAQWPLPQKPSEGNCGTQTSRGGLRRSNKCTGKTPALDPLPWPQSPLHVEATPMPVQSDSLAAGPRRQNWLSLPRSSRVRPSRSRCPAGPGPHCSGTSRRGTPGTGSPGRSRRPPTAPEGEFAC